MKKLLLVSALALCVFAPLTFTACADAQAAAPSGDYTRHGGQHYYPSNVNVDGTLTTAGVVVTSGGVRGVGVTSTPNGDTTLTSTACGTVQFIGAAGDDFTLPAPAAGCSIRFVVDAAFATTAMTIVTGSSANVIYGAVDVNSTLVPCSAEDTITIVESAELPGDFVEVLSDGTNWYVSGVAVTTGAVTCTQAS
jgi:hypothetical protein